MLPVTLDSTACYLLSCEEAWGKAITGDFAARSLVDAGLSNRESRRAVATETILSEGFRLFFEGAAAAQFRAALRSYNNEPILAPFWPADCLLSDLATCRWEGGLRLFYEPGMATWQVLAGATAPSSFTPTAACRVVPVAWCRFDKLPDPDSFGGDEAMEVDIAVVETGLAAYAIRPTGVPLDNGPPNGALTPRLLSLAPSWGAGVSSGGIELRIERERIGYGRGESESYVAQSPRRRQKVTLPPLGDEIAQLVALFREVGTVGSFWVPGAFAEARLAAASSVGSAVITVVDASVLAGIDYIALSGDTLAARKIISRNGNALTLQSSPGTFPVGTAVCSLLLARFASAKLRITWTTPTVATAAVEVVELPTETIVPAGETVGTTIGDLGTPIWLYHVTDGDLDWYFTSFESSIDAGALGTYEPRPIDHGDITSELNLERHDVDLTIAWFAGSPFERARLDRLAPPLTVQIYEGRLSTPAAAELIFTGKAAGYSFSGGKCTCKIAGMTALFDGRGPIAVTSPRCWAPLYSAPCGLIPEAVDAPAQLEATGSGALMFAPAGGGGWPATPVDHYRGGYAERTLADGSKRRHRIAGSDAVITDGYTSPLRTGLVEWWDFPEVGRVPRYGTVAGTVATRNDAQGTIPKSIASANRRRPLVGGAERIDHLDSGDTLRCNTSLISAASAKSDGITFALWVQTVSAFPPTLGIPICSSNSIDLFQVVGGVMCLAGYDLPTNFGLIPADPAGWNLIVCISGFGLQPTRIFINGASASTDRGLGNNASSAAPEIIKSGGVMGSWRGRVDQFILWNRCLSLADCDSLYNYGLGLTYADTATPGDQLVARTLGALNPAPTALPETGWRLVPGCDKSFARCKALGNGDNFRGFPHFPKTNPALMPIKQETAAGGKK